MSVHAYAHMRAPGMLEKVKKDYKSKSNTEEYRPTMKITEVFCARFVLFLYVRACVRAHTRARDVVLVCAVFVDPGMRNVSIERLPAVAFKLERASLAFSRHGQSHATTKRPEQPEARGA